MPEAGVEPSPAKRGGSVRLIALSHESQEARTRYMKIEIGDLQKMYGLYHPRESHVEPVALPRCGRK